MRVPEQLRIGPHQVVVRTDVDTAQLLRDEDARGDSRPDRLLIRVDPDRPHTSVAETLVHETIHVAWHLTPLPTFDDVDEEAVATALAPLLLGMLRDNPDLVEFLTS